MQVLRRSDDERVKAEDMALQKLNAGDLSGKDDPTDTAGVVSLLEHFRIAKVLVADRGGAGAGAGAAAAGGDDDDDGACAHVAKWLVSIPSWGVGG
jgi:hypothetical protein